MVKFKDFSRPLSVFQVLIKANFIFKDFSRQSCIFKYFSSLWEPCFNEARQMSSLNLLFVNPITLTSGQTLWSFDCFKCNRVKV